MRISSRRLGEFLVTRRVLSRDLLDELLAREEAEGVPLADLLAGEAVVSRPDLVAGVANELGIPCVDLADRTIAPEVFGLIPEDLARRLSAVAVERRADGVLVALGAPSDPTAVDALEEAIATPVIAAAAVPEEVERLLDVVYGAAPATTGVARREALTLDALLDRVLRMGASDLHLTVGTPPVVRVQGALQRLDDVGILTGSHVRRLVLGALTARQRERFEAEGELSTSHAIPGRGRFRVAAFVQRDSVAAVLRLVPGRIPAAEDLGLPDEVIAWSELRRGLVLVCGQHGSGTSTTIASLVDRINRSRACHILTVEQPIEFLHRHDRAIVNQREVGEDTESFESGLHHALRQDPDVIVAGELPDPESIRLALAAAETGHLVIATLRTMDAVQTIERIVDVFPSEQQAQVRLQIATTLRGIAVQQLLPAIGGGVALAAEVLLPTPDVVAHIRSGDSANLAKAIVGGVGSGMMTMDQSLADLVADDLVTVELAVERANDPAELRYLVSGETR